MILFDFSIPEIVHRFRAIDNITVFNNERGSLQHDDWIMVIVWLNREIPLFNVSNVIYNIRLDRIYCCSLLDNCIQYYPNEI